MSTTSGTQPRITSVAEVQAALGDRLVDSFHKDDLWLRVRTDAWKSSMRTLRDTLAAKDAFDFLGSPEGELAIAEAIVYLATAPKSSRSWAGLSPSRRTSCR